MILIIQARFSSKRLSGKVLLKIENKTVLEHIIERVSFSKKIKKIIIATSNNKTDDVIYNKFKNNNKVAVFRGSLMNVILRYLKVLKRYPSENFIRITGDCPLIDYKLIDELIKIHLKNNNDLTSNAIYPSFPDGLDVEIVKTKALEHSYKLIKYNSDKEHVTTFMENNRSLFKIENIKNNIDYSYHRWTLDEKEDYELIKIIFKKLYINNNYFGFKDILTLFKKQTNLLKINNKYNRNEGLTRSLKLEKKNIKSKNKIIKLTKGINLWNRAKKIIPGGNMLLSKRAEMFLPNQWPAYFIKSKNAHLWTLEGTKLLDMVFAVGQNTLGYNHIELEKYISKINKLGNMTSLNCSEEVLLAEKLVEMHPWAQMVRFARSGGEANSISIRIARAAAKNTRVAFSGYHGWHDWYLSANIKSKENLSSHLLPGLEPEGIPKELVNTAFPFEYNNFTELEKLVNDMDIGIIKMEVSRNYGPKNNFLKKVRNLCNKKNLILIFDECTSGFRETYGGIHLKYKVYPDIAMFGKALGNGYAINAILGKREIMECAQKTFISSTFWTERIGPAAGLKTLEIMKKLKSWEIITQRGKLIKRNWEKLAKLHSLDVSIFGLDAICGFKINSDYSNIYKTYITQEMLKRGILASNLIYVSLAHEQKFIDKYFDQLDSIFKVISKYENEKLNPNHLLDNSEAHQSFKRLN